MLIEIPGSSVIICWEMSCAWAGLGQICSAPSNSDTAGSDLPPLPSFAHSLVYRVTFPLLLDALKLWNAHTPGAGGLGGAVAVMEV